MGQLCLCLSFSVTTSGQNKPQAPAATAAPVSQGAISGVLTDSLSGSPIAFATVALLPQGGTQAQDGTLTDESGHFSFPNVPQGTYSLTFSFIGYKTKTVQQVTLREGALTVSVPPVELSPVATQLKEVSVEALRPTITQEADRMVVNIAGTALAAASTAYEVLAKSPGVYIDQEGNIQLNGRAGVTVMLDGKLTYLSARDLRNMLEGMSAENIRSIEIITNPSAKYDAEGSSGILNINLKKNDLRGMNGSVYAGATYNGKQFGYSTGGNINYKTGKWNSFLSLDMAQRVGGREATFTRVFQGENSAIYFDQVATGNYKVKGPPIVRFGTDYSLNDRHSVGFVANYGTNYLWADFLTDTYLGNNRNQPALYIEANNYNENRFANFNSNLHYLGKFDTLGTTLSADLDYVRITNDGFANFYNYYDSLASDKPVLQDFLYTDTPNGFDIYSAKLDFTKPFAEGHKLELGAKASRVISDSDSRFYFNNSEVPILDIKRTNHFIYNENIFAAYVNWSSKLSERFSLQAGLRAEQTVSEGESKTTGQVTERDYLNLFPSVFLQQKVNDSYEISYSYSRRLQRPNYGQLNPFFAYRDPYTYWQGNPYLRSQYTHAFSVTQVYQKNYSLILNYQRNQDVIAELPAIDTETATTIYYIGNVDASQSFGLTAVVPLKIMKNWDTNNTLVVSYQEYSTIVNQEQVINDQVYYMLQSNHNILLPLDLRLEVNAVYNGPVAYALYRVEPRWWVHLGLKKSFWDKKLDLSLNVNDVFKSQRLLIAADVGEGNISDFDQYFRARHVGLSLRYNFSKGQKVEERRRNTLEELNRTGN
ncbi:outer membrane receptor protein involved in Fe transport [Pontibacter ummariensis]|uniref:Outer membrane receptor proteins, mostly Fe transport n=2 Tax=Pontibacter ummariensis TaxID=1610492 RepID=A0A239JZ76_9BACT|nr:outer membrane receptor protein involved in Fe transport [Pontibacter ummariensis]SNT10144.1 Outer membrane receptor proteins, mostly Fe transport [Pontibacter ummariensis]